MSLKNSVNRNEWVRKGHSGWGGRGWKPGVYDLGTGAVVREDPVKAAQDWAKSISGKITPKHEGAWREYAARLFMMPDDIDRGWQSLGVGMRECIEELRRLLGEGRGKESWAQPTSGRQPWGGMAVPLPQRQEPTSDDPGFPWSTDTARKVWGTVKEMLKGKKVADLDGISITEIIKRAVAAAGVKSYEMTPEDLAILELAVYWKRAGKRSDMPIMTAPKIGGAPGAPGGPFRSNEYGHFLPSRGAP